MIKIIKVCPLIKSIPHLLLLKKVLWDIRITNVVASKSYCMNCYIRGLSQKVVDFSNSKKSWRMSMFIFCRNIELSILNILSVIMTTKIKRNHFYGHSISVRYASTAHAKSERNKIVYFIFDKWLYWNWKRYPLIIHIGGNVIESRVLSHST